MKKASWDAIILHMCTKNQNHMMYASQVMEYNRHNFLSFWATLCHFIPLLTPKIKISNKCKKNSGDIVLSHMCTINEDHMMCGSWDKKARQTEFFVILGHFLPFDPPNNLKNQNFEKMKKPYEDIILHLHATNDDHMMYGS